MKKIIGPMTLEDTRKYVEHLRWEEDFERGMVEKYGSRIASSSYDRIREIHKERQGYSNIHTISSEEFRRFRNGEFGFI